MSDKILFVDCDGTIREPIEGDWIQPPSNQRELPEQSWLHKISIDANNGEPIGAIFDVEE